ncbi:MAG: hypothetical protein AAFW87_00695 [Pseudomonadota bacterium]
MRDVWALVVLTAGVLPSAVDAQFTSAYTELNLPACRSLLDGSAPVGQETVWNEVGAYRKVCAGYDGYDVHFVSGDVMVAVGFAPEGQDDAVFPPEVFEAYVTVNLNAIEWRLSDGKPFAVTHRWYMDTSPASSNDLIKGEVLVISKLSSVDPYTSCAVGYIDAKANEEANALARVVADKAAVRFRCGVDTPRYHGEVGTGAANRLVLN